MDNSARSDVAAVARPSATASATVYRVTPHVMKCRPGPAEARWILITKVGWVLAVLLLAIYLLVRYRRACSKR